MVEETRVPGGDDDYYDMSSINFLQLAKRKKKINK
jgi:hypothetical protein